MNRMKKSVLVVVACLLGRLSYALEHAPDRPSPHWTLQESLLRCRMSSQLADYGIGHIEQEAAGQPRFYMDSWLDRVSPVRAMMIAKSPAWKPHGRSFLLADIWLKAGSYPIELDRKRTLDVINHLVHGFEVEFAYSDYGKQQERFALTPIDFQPTYRQYAKCVGKLLPFNYRQIRYTSVFFGTDGMSLDDTDKASLDKIARYVLADKEVGRLYIAGYADDRGRKSYNNAVSEHRARAVVAYLKALGVPESLFKVTWFGAARPVAPNDNEENMAKNRRVLVEIQKKPAQVLTKP